MELSPADRLQAAEGALRRGVHERCSRCGKRHCGRTLLLHEVWDDGGAACQGGYRGFNEHTLYGIPVQHWAWIQGFFAVFSGVLMLV
nr:hypothetical protein GCM10010200_045680 [Actinomadura rugatobispora]